MKILFVTHNGTSHEPLGLLYLSASLLRSGHETKACQEKNALKFCKEWNPEFVAFQVLTGDQERWGRVAGTVKRNFPHIKTIFGGPHFLFFSQIRQAEADIIIRGDGEDAIVSAVEGKQWINFLPIENSDSRAHPDRGLLYNDEFPGVRDNVIRNEIATFGCPYKCFVAGTKIAMYNGKQKPIEKIEIGDIVLSIDVNNGTNKLEKVTHKGSRIAYDTYEIELEDKTKFQATSEHPFWTKNGWKEISALSNNEELLKVSKLVQPIKYQNTDPGTWVRIKRISFLGTRKVYSISVSNHKNFIANGFLVHNCEYCFVKDTLINTTKGFFRIQDIVESKEEIHILDAYGEKRKVSQFHERNYIGDLISLKVRKLCIPLEGTPNHEIFTERGKIKLSEIVPGDWVKIAIPKGTEIDPFMSPRLAGYYIAEGSLTHSHRNRVLRFSFNKKETNYVKETKSLLNEHFSIPSREVTQGSVTHVELSRKFVYEFFMEKMGKGANGKFIPEEVFRWSPENKLEFLKGWFDGDGYKAQGRLCTISPNLAFQGYLLALSIGMKPSLYVREIRDSYIGDRLIHTDNQCWDIAFNFEEDIKRIGCDIRKLIGKYKRRNDYYLRFQNGDAYFKVQSITRKHHEGSVYNIGVDDEHSYTANLISVSNCFNSNENWQEMVKGKNRLRYHSPEWIIDDIERTFHNYGGQLVSFQDDIFGIDLEWLEKFARLYQRVRIPFFAQLRPRLITEDRIKLLKEAGIHIVSFAIESGNEQTRREFLDREEPNEIIEKGCTLIHKYGIKFRMQNMLGIPVKDPLSDALETLRFNMKMKPTLSWCSLLQAYPGTAIAKRVVKMGLVKSEEDLMPLVNSTFFDESSLPIRGKRSIERLQKYWSAVVRWPWLYPIVRVLIHMNFGKKFHNWIFEISKGYINKKEYWRVEHMDKHVSILTHQPLDRLGGELVRNPEKEEVCV